MLSDDGRNSGIIHIFIAILNRDHAAGSFFFILSLLFLPLRDFHIIMNSSDGSVTRHLQLLSNLEIAVDVLSMRRLSPDEEGQRRAHLTDVNLIEGPILERQILLRRSCPTRQALLYATSWWNAEQAELYLSDKSKPIWTSLSVGRLELFREIKDIYYGHSAVMEQSNYLGTRGPFWGRHYVFWHDGKPLTTIYEVFSAELQNYLGPIWTDDEISVELDRDLSGSRKTGKMD